MLNILIPDPNCPSNADEVCPGPFSAWKICGSIGTGGAVALSKLPVTTSVPSASERHMAMFCPVAFALS